VRVLSGGIRVGNLGKGSCFMCYLICFDAFVILLNPCVPSSFTFIAEFCVSRFLPRNH